MTGQATRGPERGQEHVAFELCIVKQCGTAWWDNAGAHSPVADVIARARPAAPALVRFETANIIRRHELAGLISSDQAGKAHADLLELAIEQWPHELLAHRAWEPRHDLSVYDASYVASPN